MQYRWSLNGKGYARRNQKERVDGRVVQRTVSLHRFIMGVTDPRVQVDHENRRTLDNRKENLRLGSNAQNHQNLNPNRGSRSGVRGVHWESQRGKWQAKVRLNYRHHQLGVYDTIEEAAAVVAAWRQEHMPFSEEAGRG